MDAKELAVKFNTWRINYSGYLMNVSEFRDAIKNIVGDTSFYSDLIQSGIVIKLDWHTVLIPDKPVHLDRISAMLDTRQSRKNKESNSKLEERTIKILQSLGWDLLENNNSKVLIKK